MTMNQFIILATTYSTGRYTHTAECWYAVSQLIRKGYLCGLETKVCGDKAIIISSALTDKGRELFDRFAKGIQIDDVFVYDEMTSIPIGVYLNVLEMVRKAAKKEVKYRPYTAHEMLDLVGTTIVSRESGEETKVVRFVCFSDIAFVGDFHGFHLSRINLLNDWLHLDGSICGVKED